MSHRYSRMDKEKWVEKPPSSTRRSPLRIPASDTSALIAANSLILIGRVTNPLIQRPKAIVDYLPQYWNLESKVTGRDLGPEKFQFKFESEKDMLAVLNKSPFHFKKWMLILQRWEPIISESFPSQISFWVKIHDIPNHHWSDRTIHTIGSDLGHLSATVVEDARVIVEINGLQPLVMAMEIRLPAGDVKLVRFEYEKLGKNCFKCFSLSDEVKECPKAGSYDSKESRLTDINQQKTLIRLEAERRWIEDKKDPRASSVFRKGTQLHISSQSNPRYHPYGSYSQRRSPPPVLSAKEHSRSRIGESSLWRVANHRPQSPARGSDLYYRQRRSREGDSSRSQNHGNLTRGELERGLERRSNRDSDTKSYRTYNSRTPPPRHQREEMVAPLPVDQVEVSSTPRSRRPALERLSLGDLPQGSQSVIESRGGGSDHLLDVEVHYAADNAQEDYIRSDVPAFLPVPRVGGPSLEIPRSSERISTALRL